MSAEQYVALDKLTNFLNIKFLRNQSKPSHHSFVFFLKVNGMLALQKYFIGEKKFIVIVDRTI